MLINEWRFVYRQPLWWLAIITPAAFGFVLSHGLAAVSDQATIQFQLQLITLTMMSMPLVAGATGVLVLFRDAQSQMAEMILTTPVSPTNRYLTRALMLFISVTLSALLSAAVVWINQPEPWPLISTLLTFLLIIAVPCALVLTCIMLALFRCTTALSSYVIIALLWIGYTYLASLTGNPMLAGSHIHSEALYAAMLWLDPYGFTPYLEYINGQPLFDSQALITNRILIILSALLGIFALCNGISAQLPDKSTSRSRKRERNTTAMVSAPQVSLSPFIQPEISRFGYVSSLIYQHTHILLSQKLNLLLLLGWAGLIINTVASSITYVEPLQRQSATSLLAVNTFAFDVLPLFGALFMAFWSWQLVARPAQLNIADMMAANRIGNITMVVVHAITISLMTTVLVLTSLAASLAVELFTESTINLTDYFLPLAVQGLLLILLGWMFIAILHGLRFPLLGIAVIMLILINKFTPLMAMLGVPHPLLNPAWAPLQAGSALWGYQNSLPAVLPYTLFWAAVAVTLIIVATFFSHRGSYRPLHRFSPKQCWLALPIIACCISAYWLHHQLKDQRPLYNSVLREEFKANYEQHFKHWQSIPQPVITHIDAKVDFYPYQAKAKFVLTYTLTNKQKDPIDKVLIGRAGFYQAADIQLEGTGLIQTETTTQQSTYHLTTPLQPGESIPMQVQFEYQQPRLWPAGGHQFITPKLSYLRAVPLLPTIGYQPNYELTDPHLRAKYRLSPRLPVTPSELFNHEEPSSYRYDWITMDTQLSTAADQFTLTQGELLSQTVENNRRTMHYRTRTPFRAIPAWLSLSEEPIRFTHNGGSIQISRDDNQTAVELHRQAIADTLDWFAQHLRPYPAKQLSLIAMPGRGISGYALPQIMFVGHTHGFIGTPTENAGFDQRYRRAVHETAHQWFGHDIGNGVEQDSAFLIESMAKYIELVLIERRYGEQAMLSLVTYEQRRFNQARRSDSRSLPALVDAQLSYQQYSQATLAFHELRQTLGDEVIVQALNNLWQQHRYPQQPATSMDFVRHLKAVSPVQHHWLIEQELLGQ